MMNIVPDGRGARLREQWEGKAQHGQHDVLNRSTAWVRHRFSPGLLSHLHRNDTGALDSAYGAPLGHMSASVTVSQNGGIIMEVDCFVSVFFLKSRKTNKIFREAEFRPVGWQSARNPPPNGLFDAGRSAREKFLGC